MIKIARKKIAFFASSPFQVISNANIASYFHKDHFKVLFTFDKNLKNSFFDKIYVMERKNKGSIFFYIFKTIFFPKKAIKDQIKNYDESLIFDEIYCTDCNSLMCSLFLTNLSAKLHLTEDGARNFCTQKDHYRILRKIMKIFSLPLYSDNFYNTVVFEPKMLNDNKIKSIKQPNFYENYLAKSLVLDLYKKKIIENEINFGDLIYFDQPFGFKKMEEKIFKIIREKKIKIKKHPRNNNTILNSLKIKVFEPLFIKDPKKLESLTLISISSTVLFSPKIIFNQEPKVVFLHKIFKNLFKNANDDFLCYKNKTFDQAVEKLKNLYKNKSKVLIPDNISELKTII